MKLAEALQARADLKKQISDTKDPRLQGIVDDLEQVKQSSDRGDAVKA